MECRGDGVLCGVFWPISKLVWVEFGFGSGDSVVLYQPLKALHHDGGECYGAVITEGGDCGIFRHPWFRHDGTTARC